MKLPFMAIVKRPLNLKASTRSSAILRIGLVILAWSLFADRLIIFRTFQSPDWFILGILFFIFSGMLCIGWRTKFSNIGLALILNVMVFYLGVRDNYSPFTSFPGGLIAMSMAWLCFLPSGKSFSLDRYIAKSKINDQNNRFHKEIGQVWALNLLKFQVAVVYFFAAIDKSYIGFNERLEQIFQKAYFGSYLPWEGLRFIIFLISVFTVLILYLLTFGLFIKSWHRWLMPIGIIFHVFIYLLLPVRTFSLTMILLYISFLDPNDVHYFLKKI
mgnify:FL=1